MLDAPILAAVREARADLVAAAQALIATPSPNPPLSTAAVAEVAAGLVRRLVPEAELALHDAGEGVVNVVARLRGSGAGKRIVLSGHLDTYPVNPDLPWTVDPLGGLVRDGRLHGRGAADMKGGIAASIVALAALARHRDAQHCDAQHCDTWPGEAVLVLSGDEESMGERGAQWVLDHVPHARGDAALIADAGSPSVVRFGEKGFLWIELEATGRPAHGAHVHLGTNAIDRLHGALDALAGLRGLEPDAPAEVTRAIAAARPISEPLSGAGEAGTLSGVTVNVGFVAGGTSMNLIPASARAGVDIRLPVGLGTARVEACIAAALDPLDGLAWRVLRRVEPSFTPPDGPVVAAVVAAAARVLGSPPAVNMRVGGSDARVFRAAGIPTVVYGPTPFNMGGADEYVLVDELQTVAAVLAIASARLLRA